MKAATGGDYNPTRADAYFATAGPLFTAPGQRYTGRGRVWIALVIDADPAIEAAVTYGRFEL